ncbi:MAG: EAL domain-containing protein, partial [Parasphingorhabdus sp.]
FALFASLTLIWGGVGNDVEQQLGNMRANMLEKPASGELVIVEIDAKSLQALDRWPWPRKYYAQAIDSLNDAGVSQIAFDVDFSSRSVPAQDQIFADAIARSQATVVLPTMRQRASGTQSKFIESLPIEKLRANAFLASVNVHPDHRGQLNQYSFGTTTNGIARPSLASMIAESSGSIDKSFAIDQAIDPASIPRLSFVDLIANEGRSLDLLGKKVLIGATAIELGDRYPISRFGVVPGVVIQGMASETLIQGTNLQNLGKFPALIFSAILLAICIASRKFSSEGLIGIAFANAIILMGALFLSEYLHWFTFSNFPAFCLLGVFMAMQKFMSTSNALKTSQFINTVSKLPNDAALLQTLTGKELVYIATARLSDFRELRAITNKTSRRDLFQNLANRLNFLARGERIYQVDTDMVAWTVKREYIDDISGHFDTAVALLQSPIMTADTKIKINATFGISASSLDEAKLASEQAFVAGKKWAWHDADVDQAIGEKHDLLIELDQAIEVGNLDVVYQPKWDLSSNRLGGAEALVRWSHPVQGMISPEIFIPMLEQAGRIDQLTYHVLKQALKDLASWQEQRPGLTCAVNISAQLLSDSDFVEKAIAIVERSSVWNAQLVFEVTETATMVDPEQSALALQRIQSTGIRVSIDDYGTGQSTMSYLQRLPVSEIKLDQSFIKTLVTDKTNQVMVQSTIKMAQNLGFKVVAEGIEDQACLDLLTKYGCDIGQGWHISKPVTSDFFIAAWLDRGIEEARLSA